MRKLLTPFFICLSLFITKENHAAEPSAVKENYARYACELKTFHKTLTDAFALLNNLPINDCPVTPNRFDTLSFAQNQVVQSLNNTLIRTLSQLDQYPLHMKAHIITDIANYNYFLQDSFNFPMEFKGLLAHYSCLDGQTDIRRMDQFYNNISFMKIFTNELVGQTSQMDSRRYRLNPYEAGHAALKCSVKALTKAPNKDKAIYTSMNCIDLAWIIPLGKKGDNLYEPLKHSPHDTTIVTRNKLITCLNSDVNPGDEPYQSTALSLFEEYVAHILATDPVHVQRETILTTQAFISTLYDREICDCYDKALSKYVN
jgi:hypothetical protein